MRHADMGRDGPPSVRLVSHRLGDPESTGVARYCHELVVAIAARGHAVELVTPRSPGSEAVRAVPHRSVPGPRRLVLGSWMMTGFPRITAGEDVVTHVLHPFAPVRIRGPQVWTINDLFHLRNPEWTPLIERRGLDAGVRRAIDHGDGIIAPSQATADDLHERFDMDRKRIHVIPDGVDDRFFRQHGQSSIRSVADRHGVVPGTYPLALGWVSERKNLRVVARALALVEPRDHTELLVVGPAHPSGQQDRAAIEALGDRARITGFVGEADLVPLIQGAAAVVHPSRDEGFGLVPLEAMAAGTAVLASDIPAVRETADDVAHFLPVDDPEAWAAAITALLDGSDPTLPERIACGRERAGTYAWHRTAEETIEVYRAVIG